MSSRIYPVAVKPPSGIRTWSGWPEDVRPILHSWNGKGEGHSLSFREYHVFKCVGCEEFCREVTGAILDGERICDDCLIDRARAVPDRSNRDASESGRKRSVELAKEERSDDKAVHPPDQQESVGEEKA